jgi:hypothetical protein
MRTPSACAPARAPALYAPRARCPSSLLLAAALARPEHLFSPSPRLPFLRFACALVPARHSNTCSPRRLGCPSCASRACLCCATRTFVLPIAPVVPLALRVRACAARLEHLFSPSPRLPLLLLTHAARRLTAAAPRAARRARPPAEPCLGLGLRKGGYVSGLLVAKNEGGGFLLQRKCGITGTWLPTPLPSRSP